MYAEVCRFIIRLTHLRKPWKYHDNIQQQVMVERLCFLFRWNWCHRQKIHVDYADPTPCRHFRFFVQKSFPWPSPKNPPRRNGLDWHGLQRCGNHWDIFCFRHADKKRHIDRNLSRHPQHRRPWSAWLNDFCGGVAAILREMRWNFKSIQIKYCV